VICAAVIYFFFKYQRKRPDEVGVPIHGDMRLEIAWIVLPFFLLMAMFGWGAAIYVDYRHTPNDTLDITVIGKQWMWKLQQPDGRREINELHVPVNRNVRLIMASEDVIHDFSVPAFRVKMDVVPGHYNTMWFRPSKAGKYHFFCSQYCGTSHAVMGGWVTVMEQDDYAKWLSGTTGSEDPVAVGQKLYNDLACATCHQADGKGRGPSYNGMYGSQVKLADGSTVLADDGYIRESILQPNAKLVAGYQPVMPSFQGQVTEDQIAALTAYIKSLKDQAPPGKPGAAQSATGKK
jgi:cytochrome c oxidase subunit 2